MDDFQEVRIKLACLTEELRRTRLAIEDLTTVVEVIDVRTARLEEASVAWERVRPKTPEELKARRKPRLRQGYEPDISLPDWVNRDEFFEGR